MEVTIHRGAKEIGGSCVEVLAGSTRVILDAGLPLVTPEQEPFDASVIRDKSTEELLASGVIPQVPGLYTDGTSPDALLLSHCHLDHVGLLKFTRPEIPIYATKGTSQMMSAGKMFAGREHLERDRHKPITSRQPFTIGDITVTPFAVDHSCYGSVAFLLEGDGKTVLYSGDLRAHGRKPGMIRDMVADVCKRRIDVLIMEGTHIGSGRGAGRTEYQLEDEIRELIKGSKGLVLGSFSPIDLDRVVTYYKASRAAGRTFVADVYTAYVMYMVARDIGIPNPAIQGNGIRVYFNEAFKRRSEARRKRPEELFSGNSISLDEIRATPERYVMVFRPSMAGMDFGDELLPGSHCIYSYWKGYLEKPDWQTCQEQLQKAEGTFTRAHVSGHIYIDDLVELVHAIHPGTLIPIHTFEPGGFESLYGNVTLLKDGERYTVG